MKIGWVEYNGKKSSSLGVHVSGKGTYNAAELDISSHVVPGRNGEILISNGRYKNIEVTYPAFAPSDFEARVQAVRNWMRSAEGYRRIEDNYDPDHFRMGIAKKVLTFNTSQLNRGANFQMVFDCKPQRFLKSGEEPFAVGEWGPTVLDSGDIVSFDYPNDHGAFKSLSAAITPTQNLNGYTKPWPGSGGANKLNIDPSDICRQCVKKDSADGSVTLNVNDSYYAYINLSGNNLPQEMVDRILNGEPITFEVDNNGGKTISIVVYGQRLDGTTYQEVSSVASNIVTINPEKFTSVSRVEFRFWRAAEKYTDTTTVVTGLRISYGSTATDYEPYENICPITGQTSVSVYLAGESLLPFPSAENGWKPGYYSNSGGIMPQSSINLEMYNEEYIAIPEGTTELTFTVRFSSDPPVDTNKHWRALCFYDENKNFISRIARSVYETYTSFTVPANAAFCRASIRTYGIVESLNLEYGITQKTVVQLGQTVYGGTIDVVSGALTLTHRMLTIDQNANRLAIGTSSTTWLYYCSCVPISDEDAGINTASGGGLLCDTFNVNPRADIGNAYITGVGKTLVFVLPDQTIDTVEKARVWLTENPVTLVYELAEPKTVQLTGRQINTLLGENNVWTSTGEFEAEWGDNPGVLGNPTQFPSRPIIKVTNPAAGATVSIGGQVMTCSEAYSGEVIIDCNQMNIYSGSTNLNSKWAGEFPAIAGGNSDVSFTGADSVEVIPNWWEL